MAPIREFRCMSCRAAGRRCTTRRSTIILVAALALTLGGRWATAGHAGGSSPRDACRPAGGARIALRVAFPRTPMDAVQRGQLLWVALAGRHVPRTGKTLAGGSIVAVDAATGRIVRTLRKR